MVFNDDTDGSCQRFDLGKKDTTAWSSTLDEMNKPPNDSLLRQDVTIFLAGWSLLEVKQAIQKMSRLQMAIVPDRVTVYRKQRMTHDQRAEVRNIEKMNR